MTRVLGRKPIDRSRIQNVLVRATNWVGDVVMTIPALEAVKENFPDAALSVLAKPWVAPLLENLPYVNEVVLYRKGNGIPAGLIGTIKTAAGLRKSKYDLAILFQNAFEAAMLTYFAGIEFRVGYNTDGRSFLLSHAVVRDDEILKIHQVEYYLNILRAMGWKAPSRDPSLAIAETDRVAVRRLLSSHGIESGNYLLGLSPGAIFGPAKRWPPERFALIGDRAVERWGAKVIIFGSRKEEEVCMAVSRSMQNPALNLCGMTSLGEAMALIKSCDLFVTNDSGLMHVAAAFNIPMIAIFGSTDSVATGPRSRNARVVQNMMDCAPCLKPECPREYECLTSIEPEKIWKEMESLKR
ncbi:lipopolysaccharide heptosyltransferase II [Thermodesulfobacteriota bacterium]